MFRLENVIIGILIFAAFALAIVFLLGEGLIHRDPKPPPEVPVSSGLPPSPMEPAALAALEAFFEAPDLATKAALVRDSARVRPLMENYHHQRGHSFPSLGRVSPGLPAHFDGTPMVLFEVEPFSGPRYPVAVAWDGHRFAVDWESLTAYGTLDWSEFIETKPAATAILRVVISTAAADRKIPDQPAETGQFQIEHRDDPQPLVALADPELTTQLTKLTEGLRTPVTLEMTWKPNGPGGTLTACISGFVAKGWSP